MSLPSRERGLKSYVICVPPECHTSLPSRERGLKYFIYARIGHNAIVAPLAGAWIEIPVKTPPSWP